MLKNKRILAGLISVVTVFSMATTAFAAEPGQTGQTGQEYGQGGRGNGHNITEKMDTLLDQGILDETLYDSIQSYMDENAGDFTALMAQDRMDIYDELLENGIITIAQYEAISAYISEKYAQSGTDGTEPTEKPEGEQPANGAEPTGKPGGQRITAGTELPEKPEQPSGGNVPSEMPTGEMPTDGTGRLPAMADGMSSVLYENGIIDEKTQTAIQAYMESRQENMAVPENGGHGAEQNVFALLLEKGIITQSQYDEIIASLSKI